MSDEAPRRYPKDALGRRKRGHRTPTGKFVELDEITLAILTVLAQNRFARTRLLYEMLPAGIRQQLGYAAFQQRITKLFNETNTAHGGAYIDWPRYQRNEIDGKRQTDYYAQGKYRLSRAGRRALEEYGYDGHYASDLVTSRLLDAGENFDHAMMICDAIALFRIGIAKDPSLRFISSSEIYDNLPEETKKIKNPFLVPVGNISHHYPKSNTYKTAIIPHILFDDIFGIEYTKPTGEKVRRYIPVEAEKRTNAWRSSLRQPSTLRKILAYREIVRQRAYYTHLGLPNYLPLFISDSAVKSRNRINAALEATKGGGSNIFTFKTLPIITGLKTNEENKQVLTPLPDFFTEPFLRAGREDWYFCDLRNDTK